jgi:TatD DNase family protein
MSSNPEKDFNLKFIDIHTHVNFAVFDADREEVIDRALSSGTAMINVGTQKDTSAKAVEIAHQYKEGVYAIVGVHPIHADAAPRDEDEIGPDVPAFTSRGEAFDYDFYKNLATDPKVVAIGECGLDYFHSDESAVAKQRANFIAQIELANELNKPLMLHIRNGKERATAYKDVYDILKSHAKVGGNAHFFAGNWEEAKLFLDMGYTISFTGVITFASQYEEVIRNTPLDRIMSETDAPFVSPVPYRGKRNEPFYVQEVVKRIAEIKNLPFLEVQNAIITTADRSFNLGCGRS